MRHDKISLDGRSCKIFGDRRLVWVQVHHYPSEAFDSVIEEFFMSYGTVKFVKRQHWVALPDVQTGTRLVGILLDKQVPRNVIIGGFNCKTRYRGQPVTCDLCGEDGHVLSNCPIRGKCRRCKEPGHFARDCPRSPWKTPPGPAPASGSVDPTPAEASAPLVSTDLPLAPNRNPARDLFFDEVIPFVDPAIPTVLCGDFNTVFDRSMDRRGSDASDVSRESTAALVHLFDSCCVIDTWRYLHPSSSCYTWLSPDGSVSSRIDYIGCPYVWVSSVSSCDIVPCPFSDHCAVSLSVSVPDVVPPGPGLWKLNTSVLEEEGYVHLISNFWNGWRCQCHLFPSLVKWWEMGKSRIKGLTVHYCCSRSSALSVKRDLLSRLSSHLKDRVDNGQLSLVETYQSVLHQLAELDVEVAKGAQVRARARWIEEGESSSAYFFRLEKKCGADRWISAIRNDDGTIVSAPDDLCLSFSSFSSSLFTASLTDASAQESLLGNVVSSLPGDQSDSCEGLLTVDECFAALVGMARRKARGSDGLPAEFYLKFWAVLGEDLVQVLNSCYRSGSFSLSQRRGVILLSFKKGDRLDMWNWRPISLLNVDYKLAARTIAARLLKVIHLVVAKDQTCGVPGRYIGENVAFLRDVVSFADTFDSPVAILSLDQEKAFDRVDWGFMYATLRKMGFSSSFLKWVSLFYTDVQSAVNVNGYLSPFFSLSRGVRQGCPLSPLLYVLVSEVLACNVPIPVSKVFVSLIRLILCLQFLNMLTIRRWLFAPTTPSRLVLKSIVPMNVVQALS